MVSIEDLKIYFFDSFLSTNQWTENSSGTAYITKKVSNILMHAGVTSGSIAKLYYNHINFNPQYSEIVMKMSFHSKQDIFAFWGFKETIADPTPDMVESHSGFMIDNGKFYISTGDGVAQQKVEIVTVDVTKMFEYRIKYNEFSYNPLPITETYLEMPEVPSFPPTPFREWKVIQTNYDRVPLDQVHYIMFYLKNLSIGAKYLNLNRVIYKEEYAD